MGSIKIQHSVLLILVLLSFFGFKLLSFEKLDYVYLFLLVIMALPVIKDKSGYARIIKFYLLFVLVSCFYSAMYNGQKLHSVIGHSYDFFAILFFFVLIRFNLSSEETEKVLVKVSVWFCCCYILQWMIYPVVLFSGADDSLNVTAYQYRARMPGSICGYFLLMYSVNRYMTGKNIKYFFYGILAFIPILIQGFRSLIALTVVAVFLMMPFVLRNGRKVILYVLLAGAVGAVALTTSLVQSKMEEMMERQEGDQTFENDDYIRFLSLDYYWNQQFIKPYEKLIGGGNPVDTSSRYFKGIDAAKEQYGFYWSDLGVVGLSMIIGLPAVLLLIVMYFRCMWKCKEQHLQCIRFTLFIVFLGSIFTTAEIYRTGNLLMLSLFLYIEYKYHIEQKSLTTDL